MSSRWLPALGRAKATDFWRVSALCYGKHNPQKNADVIERVVEYGKRFFSRCVGMPEHSHLLNDILAGHNS